jgi:hypothetical protein
MLGVEHRQHKYQNNCKESAGGGKGALHLAGYCQLNFMEEQVLSTQTRRTSLPRSLFWDHEAYRSFFLVRNIQA